MSTLTPPTDNLYKFWAISWLLAFLFCVGYPSYYTQKLGELTSVAALEVAKATGAIAPLLAERNAVGAQIERFKHDGETDELNRALESQKVIEAQFSGQEQVVATALAEAAKSRAPVDFIINHPGEWLTVSGVALTFSLLGFLFWWVNFQRYQDMQLKADARMAALRFQRYQEEPPDPATRQLNPDTHHRRN